MQVHLQNVSVKFVYQGQGQGQGHTSKTIIRSITKYTYSQMVLLRLKDILLFLSVRWPPFKASYFIQLNVRRIHFQKFDLQRLSTDCITGLKRSCFCKCHKRADFLHYFSAFHRSTNAVLGVVFPSVRLSVTCVLYDKTKQCTADMMIPHKMAITLVFWHK